MPSHFIRSRHVSTHEREHNTLVYHSLVGNGFKANGAVVELLDHFGSGSTVVDAARALGVSVERIEGVVGDLIQRGMLVPFVDGFAREIEADDPSLRHYHLRLLRLYVTKTCNMACTYCFEPEHLGAKMDLETAQLALRAYRRWIDESPDRNYELIKINFFGGEPLVCRPLLEAAAPYAREVMDGVEKNVRLTINTNATLIDPEVARWIVDNRIHVYTSLDGMKETNDKQRIFANGRGSFDAVIRGLGNLLEAGDDEFRKEYITILCTVSPVNLGDIEDLSGFLYELGIRNMAFNAAFSCAAASGGHDQIHWTSLSKEEMRDFTGRVTRLQKRLIARDFHIGGMWAYVPQRLREGGTVFCQAVGNEIGVSAARKLYPCPTTLDSEVAEIGELSPDGRFLFNHVAYKWKERTNDKIAKCTNCSIQGICRGGCPASSLLNGFDIYDAQQCDYWFSIVDSYLDTM